MYSTAGTIRAIMPSAKRKKLLRSTAVNEGSTSDFGIHTSTWSSSVRTCLVCVRIIIFVLNAQKRVLFVQHGNFSIQPTLAPGFVKKMDPAGAPS